MTNVEMTLRSEALLFLVDIIQISLVPGQAWGFFKKHLFLISTSLQFLLRDFKQKFLCECTRRQLSFKITLQANYKKKAERKSERQKNEPLLLKQA